MRWILITVVLTACAPEGRPLDELVPCTMPDVSTNIVQCYRVCRGVPFNPRGPADCVIGSMLSGPRYCPATLAFDEDGERGCCDATKTINDLPTLIYEECM